MEIYISIFFFDVEYNIQKWVCDLYPPSRPQALSLWVPVQKGNMEVAKVIRLTEKTSGRDKLCRVVQYGCKFIYWVLEQGSVSPELISKLKDLESSISTARKCEQATVFPPNANELTASVCMSYVYFTW